MCLLRIYDVYMLGHREPEWAGCGGLRSYRVEIVLIMRILTVCVFDIFIHRAQIAPWQTSCSAGSAVA